MSEDKLIDLINALSEKMQNNFIQMDERLKIIEYHYGIKKPPSCNVCKHWEQDSTLDYQGWCFVDSTLSWYLKGSKCASFEPKSDDI